MVGLEQADTPRPIYFISFLRDHPFYKKVGDKSLVVAENLSLAYLEFDHHRGA